MLSIEQITNAVDNIYTNPKYINAQLDSFNKQNPAHAISDNERKILTTNPELFAAFDNGVRDLVATGKTTITALSNKPAVVEFLRHTVTENLVKENIITIEQLATIPANNLQGALNEMDHGKYADVAQTLGLHGYQAKACTASIERTEKSFLEKEGQRYNTIPQNTPALGKVEHLTRS